MREEGENKKTRISISRSHFQTFIFLCVRPLFYLAETTVSLARQTSDTPTRDDTLVSVTLCDTEDIDVVVDSEDGSNRHLSLEEALGVVDLSSDIPTVDLDLEQVSLLLAQLEETDLGVSQNTDDMSMLLEAVELSDNIDVLLVRETRCITIERLLLAAIPVLVESSLDRLVEVLSPDGGQSAKTAGSVDIANKTDDVHRRALHNRDCLHSLTLVKLGTRLVDLTQDVSHTSLVAHERGQMRLLGRIVARERPNATAVVLGTLAGQEPQRTVTRLNKETK
jgi:hypothetical protein